MTPYTPVPDKPKPSIKTELNSWRAFKAGLVDEVHLHQDLEGGYRWSVVGEADWVPSHCSPLKNRLNWYDAYDFTQGQCLIWQQGGCDSDQTVAFLNHLAQH
jgi:hypothetical protein